MSKYFMFGQYSSDSLKGISADRTKKANAIIKKHGGKILSIYALLGKFDLVFIVELPGVKEAVKASVEITKLTGIAFTTSPAIEVQDFDKLVGKK